MITTPEPPVPLGPFAVAPPPPPPPVPLLGVLPLLPTAPPAPPEPARHEEPFPPRPANSSMWQLRDGLEREACAWGEFHSTSPAPRRTTGCSRDRPRAHGAHATRTRKIHGDGGSHPNMRATRYGVNHMVASSLQIDGLQGGPLAHAVQILIGADRRADNRWPTVLVGGDQRAFADHACSEALRPVDQSIEICQSYGYSVERPPGITMTRPVRHSLAR